MKPSILELMQPSTDQVRDNLLFVSFAWFLFLIFCNIYGYIYVKLTGSLEYIFHGFYLPDGFLAEISLVLVLIFYFIVALLFYFGSKAWLPVRLNLSRFSSKRKFFDFFMIFLLALYIYQIILSGVGMAGGEQVASIGFFGYFFVLVRVDYLAIIYVFLFRLSRSSVLILALVLMSSFLRGWVGDILILMLAILGLSSFNFKVFFFSKYFFYTISIVFLAGVLLQLRLYYRLGGLESLLLNLDVVTLDYYLGLPHELMMRFQQIYSLIYILGNFNYFYELYSSGSVTPIYFEGAVPKTIFSVLVGAPGDGLGYLLADHNRDLVVGRKTAFTPGILAHIVLNPFSFVYLIIVPLISGLLVSFYGGNRGFLIIMYIYVMNLFSFGWASAYFSVLMAVLVLSIIILSSSGLVRSRMR